MPMSSIGSIVYYKAKQGPYLVEEQDRVLI